MSSNTFNEKHYTVKEVAEKLRCSTRKVLRIVKTEPGVVHLKVGMKKERAVHLTPESVFRRIYNRSVA